MESERMEPDEVEAELSKIRLAFNRRNRGSTPLERARNASALHNHAEWYIDFLLQLVDERTDKMKVWTCTDHDIHYPVGGASVVVAETEDEARAMLDSVLVERHLKPSADEPYTLVSLDLAFPGVVILRDGDY